MLPHPEARDATRTQRSVFEVGTEQRKRRQKLSRLSYRRLTAGQCRPPCRDLDVRPPRQRAGRAARDRAALTQTRLMQTGMCRSRHDAPLSIVAARTRWLSAFLRPLTVVGSVSLRVPRLPSMRAHETHFSFSFESRSLPSLRCRSLPAEFWAKVSRPLFEEPRLRSHLLNSVGEPGGVWKSDNTMRRGCKILNVARCARFAGTTVARLARVVTNFGLTR